MYLTRLGSIQPHWFNSEAKGWRDGHPRKQTEGFTEPPQPKPGLHTDRGGLKGIGPGPSLVFSHSKAGERRGQRNRLPKPRWGRMFPGCGPWATASLCSQVPGASRSRRDTGDHISQPASDGVKGWRICPNSPVPLSHPAFLLALLGTSHLWVMPLLAKFASSEIPVAELPSPGPARREQSTQFPLFDLTLSGELGDASKHSRKGSVAPPDSALQPSFSSTGHASTLIKASLMLIFLCRLKNPTQAFFVQGSFTTRSYRAEVSGQICLFTQESC